MQSAPFRIWTQLAVSISYGANRYATSTSQNFLFDSWTKYKVFTCLKGCENNFFCVCNWRSQLLNWLQWSSIWKLTCESNIWLNLDRRNAQGKRTQSCPLITHGGERTYGFLPFAMVQVQWEMQTIFELGSPGFIHYNNNRYATKASIKKKERCIKTCWI